MSFFWYARLFVGFIMLQLVFEPPHDKTNKMTCALRRLRSAWASAQSDQSLRCPHAWRNIGRLRSDRPDAVNTLIRQAGCPGWSESSLGAHVILLVLSCTSSYLHSPPTFLRASILSVPISFNLRWKTSTWSSYLWIKIWFFDGSSGNEASGRS